MWDLLTHDDLDYARQELQLRRVAILKRQAEELHSLDCDREQVETLDRLAASFALKFNTTAVVETATADQRPIAPAKHVEAAPPAPNAVRAPSHQVHPEPRRWNRRDAPESNFDQFARARAEATF